MKKRIFSLMLVLTMLLGLLPTGAMAAEITTISTKAELEVFRDSVNSGDAYEGKTVTLTADIGLNGSEENPWTPIGTSSNQFQGAFDGGGHKITGLYINDSSSSTQGLFGCIGEGGTVKNLGVDGSVTGDSSIGGVVGTNKGTVENCYNTAAVTGDSTVGGVIGFSRSTVTGCYYDNSVYTAAGTTSGVTGMPTADFAAQSSFSGWDFDTVWQMDAALGRPILRAAKEEPPHTHAVSTDCSATEGTQVNFTAWNKTDSLPDTAGNYVLTGDVALSKAWTVPQGTVNLCLGGHTVKVDGIFSTAAIMVPTGAALNICDCAGGGALTHRTGQPVISVVGELQLYSGVIAGRGYNSAYSGQYGVGVRSGGVFQMHGGSITGITTNTGCGVYVYDNGVFLMDGGTITGNLSGVYVNSEGVFRAEGNVVIHGNSSGSPRNVVMYNKYDYTDGKTMPVPVPMELSGPLGANAKLGLGLYSWSNIEEVSPYLAVQGAGGYAVTADDFAKLSSDKPDDYPLKLTDGKVYFTTPQSHSHPVCGETCAHKGDETHEAMTFDKALTAEMVNGDMFEDAYTLSEGNYYLAGDIETEKEIEVSGNVNLCFNGHTITYHGGSYKKAFITVASGAALNTCDCQSGGGVKDTRSVTGGRETRILKAEGEAALYGGAFNSMGAHGGVEVTYSGKLTVDGADVTSKSDAVYLWQLGRLTIKSGTLKADQPSDGVVVIHSTDFIMEGGTITTDDYHTGVCFAEHGYGGGANAGDGGGTISGGTIKGGIGIRVNGDQTVTLSGAPDIDANTDIYFCTPESGLLQVGDDLTGKFRVKYYISITENNPYTFTTPADKDYSGLFTLPSTDEYKDLEIKDVVDKATGKHTVQICKPSAQSHSHPVCGETCTHEGGETHEAVSYTALTQAVVDEYEVQHHSSSILGESYDYITIPAGRYYLEENITTDKMVKLGGNVDLCFNGCTFTSTFSNTSSQRGALMLSDNTTLNVCDCQSGGGFTSDGEYGLMTDRNEGRNCTVNLYGGIFAGKRPVFLGSATDGTLTLDGATLNATDTALGASGGKVTIKSGSITSNSIYAVNIAGGDLTVTGGTIRNTGDYYALRVVSPKPVKLLGSPVIHGGSQGDICLLYSTCKLEVGDLTGTYRVAAGTPVKEAEPWTITTPADVDQSGHFTLPDTDAYKARQLKDVVDETTGKHTVQLVQNHAWAAAWSSDANGHWHACTASGCGITDYANCGEIGAAYGAHVYDNSQDATCNTCGYTRTVTPPTPGHTHSWATAWTSDANGHWHACTASGCGITDYANCGETGAAYGAHVYDNDQDKTCNTCGYERELSYAISGTVTDHEGSRLENVTVTLMQGNTVVATATTDSQGNYSFNGVPAGLYNVAAEKDGVTKTILVEMTGANAAEKNIQMPEGRTNSVVEVKGSDTPAAVAGGVDAVAEAETEAPGQTVTVKLTVEAKEEPEDKAELDRVISGKKDDVLYLDLSLEKQINDQEPQAITDTGDKVLEIAVPYDFTGKKDVTVYRRHGEQNAEALDKLTARPAGSFADRAFFADSRSGMVYIYASKFSTYAIGYTETTTPNPPDSGSTVYYTLTATAGLGGAITPSGMVIVPRNGDKSFSITPDEGYVVADVLVDGESVGAVAEYTVEKVTANHTIAVSFRKDDGRPAWNPFVDVNTGHWFHDSVKAVYEQGLMVGTDRNHFSPDWDTSRAMIATIIWRLEGSPEPKGQLTYTDCSSKAYYAKAVAWGTENDILAGYGGGLFGPDDPITREQLAAILWRCAGFPASSGTLTGFTDTDKASRYAVPALEWAVEQDIITGKGGGILDPLGKATRAEAAAMFTRFCELRK